MFLRKWKVLFLTWLRQKNVNIMIILPHLEMHVKVKMSSTQNQRSNFKNNSKIMMNKDFWIDDCYVKDIDFVSSR